MTAVACSPAVAAVKMNRGGDASGDDMKVGDTIDDKVWLVVTE